MIDPIASAQVLGTAMAFAAVVWAVFRKNSADAADQAQADATQNWRELAESREAQLRERDAEITELTTRMNELERRFAALEAENKVLRELGNSAAQVAAIAAELEKVHMAQHQETLTAIQALADKM